MLNAKIKPAHAALTSNEKALLAPIFCCTLAAVEGVNESGVIVATIIKSSSDEVKSASFKVFSATLTHISDVFSSIAK